VVQMLDRLPYPPSQEMFRESKLEVHYRTLRGYPGINQP